VTRLRSFLIAALLAIVTILTVPFAARADPSACVPNFGDNTLSVIDSRET
jgi:hypothetical protein